MRFLRGKRDIRVEDRFSRFAFAHGFPVLVREGISVVGGVGG